MYVDVLGTAEKKKGLAVEFFQQLKYIRVQLGCTQKQLAEMLGLSTGAVHKYENQQMQPTMKTYNKVKKLVHDKNITINTDSEKGETMSTSQQSMLIEYQKAEIEQLKQKISQKEDVYDGIQSDIRFSFEVKFNWSLKNPGVKVKYLSQDSKYIPLMAKKLGYTESEMIHYLQIDKMVEYKNHNIHKLRTQKQKEEMLGIMDNFMNAYRSIRVNTTMLVAEIPVLYTHKNGTAYKANVEYRVNWVKGTGTAHIRWLKD